MCRTGGRRCPSSRRTGADLAAYNQHRRELYAKKKVEQNKQQKFGELKQKWNPFKKNEVINPQEVRENIEKNLPQAPAIVEIPNDASTEDVQAFFEKANVTDVIAGKASDASPQDDPQTLAQFAEYQAAADELLSHFRYRKNADAADDALDIPYDPYDIQYADMRYADIENFKLIGTGVDKLVYLHEKTGLVYKVLCGANAIYHEDKYLEDYEHQEQYLIASIDDESLSKNKVRYAKNYFMRSSQGVPIIAQEYLPDDTYKSYDLYWGNQEIYDNLRKSGFIDLHEGNVKKNFKTGEIVLFDCLQIGLSWDAGEQGKK